MNTSACVKALITNAGIKQGDLAPVLGVGSVQAVSNKFRLNRWTAEELVKVAEFTGCKLAFVFPDGERIVIGDGSGADPASGTRGGLAAAGAAESVPSANSNKKDLP